MENLPATTNFVSLAFPSSPMLAELFGLTPQKEYPPVIRYLPNDLLTPAPENAVQALEEYLASRSVLFGGIQINRREEYLPNLVNTSEGAGNWPSLSDAEKTARIATSILRAFQALDTVIAVSGKANSLRPPLTLTVEDLRIGQSNGRIVEGTYLNEKNQMEIDLTASRSIFFIYAHYLNFAVASRTGRTQPASSFKRGWRGLVKDMRQSNSHWYFEMFSSKYGRILDNARDEKQIIARFFEGYIMHKFLKQGVDIAPAFIPRTLLKRDVGYPPIYGPDDVCETQPTLSTGLGREALQIEPYKYEEYEEFGGRLMLLIRAGLQA